MEFGSELERVVHESKHVLEDKPYKCFHENCKSQFQLRATLLRHIDSHTKVKKYKCRYCDQRFHQLGNAKSHERYHTGEKPYVCDHCGKSFAESGNLKAHIRFHTGERYALNRLSKCINRINRSFFFSLSLCPALVRTRVPSARNDSPHTILIKFIFDRIQKKSHICAAIVANDSPAPANY